MNHLLFDDENYYFQVMDELEEDRQFVLIIYDITDNQRRVKFAKLMEGYGKRVQKSAFEAMITEKLYGELIDCIPKLIDTTTDSVRIYKIRGQAEVSLFGIGPIIEDEEIVII